MNISPQALAENNYVQSHVFSHQELVPFLQPYLRKKNIPMLFYWIFTFMSLGLVLGYMIGTASKNIELNRGEMATHFFYGFTLAFLLVPIHELLHALAYKIVGAKDISFKAEWKKFYFITLAHHFVANRKEFYWIALLPFATITVVGLLLVLFVPFLWKITLLSMVCVHAAFCGGDFGLISFFESHKDQKIVTYDDIIEEKTYFYVSVIN